MSENDLNKQVSINQVMNANQTAGGTPVPETKKIPKEEQLKLLQKQIKD